MRIQLIGYGLPADFFDANSDRCRSQIIGYRFVSWLDDDNVAVGFNVSPPCRVAPDVKVDGLARVLVFNRRGALKARRDIPYAADGYGEIVAEGEAEAGPNGTLLFRMQGVNLDPEGRNESKSGVLLLDANLKDVVRIDQFLEQITFGARSLVFNNGGGPNSYSMFKQASQEPSSRWQQNWPTGTMDRKFGENGVAYAICRQELRPGEFVSTDIVYSGARRSCSLVVEQKDGNSWTAEFKLNSTASIIGFLADGGVVGELNSSGSKAGELVIWRKDRPAEELPWIAKDLCGSVQSGTVNMTRYLVLGAKTCASSRLFVFDRDSQKPLVDSGFPGNARADLAPNGSAYATFEHGELRMYALPTKP